MELFDPKYIYSPLRNDYDPAELIGKKVFVANTLKSLQLAVMGGPSQAVTIDNIEPYKKLSDFPFRTCKSTWSYAYYDPYYEVRYASIHGSKIEIYDSVKDEWHICKDPAFAFPAKYYRIAKKEQNKFPDIESVWTDGDVVACVTSIVKSTSCVEINSTHYSLPDFYKQFQPFQQSTGTEDAN